MMRAFSALAGASSSARFSASTRSASANAALAMARFCTSSTAASASRLRPSPDLVRLGSADRQFGLRGGDLGLREVFSFDGRRVGIGHLHTHFPLGLP